MKSASSAAPVLGTMVLLAALVLAPAPATAQCGMMGTGGGGHDHSRAGAEQASRASSNTKKLRRNIDQALAGVEGRELLAEAIVNDRAFVDLLLDRLVKVPQLRARVAERIQGGGPVDAMRPAQPADPAVPSALYACPMHSDVTSPNPGECPKCGMALVRSGGGSK